MSCGRAGCCGCTKYSGDRHVGLTASAPSPTAGLVRFQLAVAARRSRLRPIFTRRLSAIPGLLQGQRATQIGQPFVSAK